MSDRDQAIQLVRQLMRPKPRWWATTNLTAVGVSCQLEVTTKTRWFGVVVVTRSVKADTPLFDAVLRLREKTLVNDDDWFVQSPALDPWFKAIISNPGTKTPGLHFNYFDEPKPFGRSLTEAELVMDLIEYTRGVDNLPQWYRETIGFKEFNDDDSLKKI
jgi:hypothetical protein